MDSLTPQVLTMRMVNGLEPEPLGQVLIPKDLKGQGSQFFYPIRFHFQWLVL